MRLNLLPNVYIVNGAIHSCIYNLNTNQLIPITRSQRSVIDKLLQEEISESNLTIEDKEILDLVLKSKSCYLSKKSERKSEITDLVVNQSLSFAWIEVLRKCNLECVHCYEKSTPQESELMSLDVFEDVLEGILNTGCRFIQLIGGEPLLLRSKLKDMIILAKNKGIETIEVFTNGILVNDEWVQFFKDYNIRVAISFYSTEEEEHEKVTIQRGSFSKTKKNIIKLEEAKIPLRVVKTRIRGVDPGEETIEEKVKLDTYYPKFAGSLSLNNIDIDIFEKKAITLKKFLRTKVSKFSVMKNISGHNFFQTKVYINTYGDLYPCVMERRMSYGNIRDEKVWDLYNEEKNYFSKDFIESCKSCEFRYACFDCRPDNGESDITKKPYNCTYKPEEGRWLSVKDQFINVVQEMSTSQTRKVKNESFIYV
jgi:radical SAM protein with 4Fe4S-binding SPASM domain